MFLIMSIATVYMLIQTHAVCVHVCVRACMRACVCVYDNFISGYYIEGNV